MKLQLAIDRVSKEKMFSIITDCYQYTDIIEVGTSIIKEYGVEVIKQIKNEFKDVYIFADIKTNDEAEYEFELYYKAGADCLSVMGTSSIETIKKAQQIAQKYNKDYSIDLMETDSARIKQLSQFNDAVFCIHVSMDSSESLIKQIERYRNLLPNISTISVAGGIDEDLLSVIRNCQVNIVIVGRFITSKSNIKENISNFYRKVKYESIN
ncbi:orotidine 5'-phosphate decarboxylase / HUMPS family protein [Erysipelotrichaceae bacterium HCN-30851]